MVARGRNRDSLQSLIFFLFITQTLFLTFVGQAKAGDKFEPVRVEDVDIRVDGRLEC